MENNVEIRFMTRRNLKVSRLRLCAIKEKVLGKKYDLSIVFAGEKRMRNLNKKYRKKDKTASVLSFPLSSHSGEIFINSAEKNIQYLFIHALLHLKGFQHSSTMESEERKIGKFFKIFPS